MDLIFMCADSGAVVALTCHQARRLEVDRAVVFLASGETAWISPQAGRSIALERHGSQDGAGYDLRMSAQATLLTAVNEIVSDELPPGRPLPASFAVTLEPVSVEVALGDQVSVVMVQGSGSLAVGSVIYRLRGSGWSSSRQSGGPTGYRARAVFQDGSALFATAGSPHDDAAALVVNTRIRRVPVDQFVLQGRDGGPARKVLWKGADRSHASVTGEIRNVDQYVSLARPAPGGIGWLSWSATPFVFVRSGVTGLGLVEHESQASPAYAAPVAEEALPDPY